jgi:signal transduction histidine kinase
MGYADSKITPVSLAEKNPSQSLPAKQTLIVSILSSGENSTLEGTSWQLTFKQLNQHPDYQFTPLFLTREQLAKYLREDAVDFIISDAVNYRQLEDDFGILRLLTRSVLYDKTYFNFEAISIYVSNRNTSITRVTDIKNKQVALLDNQVSVSQQLIDYFLFAHHLNPNKDLHLSRYHKLNEVIPLLHNKKLDALIVKSGYLKKVQEKEPGNTPNSLQKNYLQEIHIINPRKGWQAPFMHTSILIPEWAFAKAWFIDEKLANQVASLLITSNDTKNEVIPFYFDQYHWSTAQKYPDIKQMLELPADLSASGIISLTDNNQPSGHQASEFFKHKEYWIAFFSFLALTIIFVLYLKSSRDLNRRLQKSKANLEQEIQERQHAQELALLHQAELAHVARLSTMGEMASGLAHELNQPLSAIHTYVQGCIRRINMGTDEPDAIINALELTAQQANRAGEIIRRLRSFVRKGETHKTYTDINHVVNEVTTFLETQIKDQEIKLNYQFEENLPPVLTDIIQLEQVLINLLKNAIESMADGQEQILIITTKRINSDHIELCVIDSGHGISEDKLKRVFNPFFTTKESGMGMGLSISNSIIEAHDGKLYAKNNPHQGARFCFTLPVKDELPKHNN